MSLYSFFFFVKRRAGCDKNTLCAMWEKLGVGGGFVPASGRWSILISVWWVGGRERGQNIAATWNQFEELKLSDAAAAFNRLLSRALLVTPPNTLHFTVTARSSFTISILYILYSLFISSSRSNFYIFFFQRFLWEKIIFFGKQKISFLLSQWNCNSCCFSPASA